MEFKDVFDDFIKGGENISHREIEELEEAIQNSKQTASAEDGQRQVARRRRQNEQQSKKPTNDVADDGGNAKPKPSPPPWTKPYNRTRESEIAAAITFQDLRAPSGRFLKIMHHPPIFELPIPTNPQLSLCYSSRQRAKLLYDYYTRVDALQASLAKTSIQRAPWPRPILSSSLCKDSLSRDEPPGDDGKSGDEFAESSSQEVYVSRAGRHIKRKIYTEENEIDSDPDASCSKKNKVDIKITLDTPAAVVGSEAKSCFPPAKKAFSRAETLFDNLVLEDGKRRQHQEKMDKFELTLPPPSTVERPDEDVETSAEIRSLAEENVKRRRIPLPPLPIKRGGRMKKSPKREESEAAPTGNIKRFAKIKQKIASPTNFEDDTNVVSCPICNQLFAKSEIENHASSCGVDDDEMSDDRPVISGQMKKVVKCDLCDQTFEMSVEYEIHVKECIARKITDL